jgi:hypothetical protein
MAFGVQELEQIRSLLDSFCESRSPAEHFDELRLAYDIEGHSVTVFEERPDWRGSGEIMRTPVAKFRFYRSRDEWSLYWMRADMKWHLYEPAAPSRTLSRLMGHVDRDTYCCFFG